MKATTPFIAVFSAIALALPCLAAEGPGIATRTQVDAKQAALTENSNITVSNITSKGHLSLSGQTNRLTISGDALLLDGAEVGGDTIGDPFVVTSAQADNATNVAVVVDTENFWDEAGGLLASFRNAGTNQLLISHTGGLMIGKNSLAYWGGPAENGEALVKINDTSAGDPANNRIYLLSTDGSLEKNFDVRLLATSAAITLYEGNQLFDVRLSEGGSPDPNVNLTLAGGAAVRGFIANVGAPSGTTPYGLDTIKTHSTGNLLEVRNASTNQFQVTFDGRPITQGGTAITPASAGAAGTAGTIVWDADYIYICVAPSTWKRVAIATWP